jgi:hypothetical protein
MARRVSGQLPALVGLAFLIVLPAWAQEPRPRPTPAEVPHAELPDAEVPDAEVPDAEMPDAEAAEAETPPATDPAMEADLFAMPRIAAESRVAMARLQIGEIERAMRILDGLAERHPGVLQVRANRAAVAMLAGDGELAAQELAAAAALGLPDLAAVLADPLFAPIAADPRFAEVEPVPPVPAPVPAPVVDGEAVISAANTGWNPATERLEPRFVFAEASPPDVLPPTPRAGAYDLLRDHWRLGRAAGNHGDLYDNRDRGHSTLRRESFPQLTHVEYSAAAQAAEIDYGLNDAVLFDRPTLGNSSTALTEGPHWRSMPRLGLTRADGTGPMRLWQNADNNHLYVHPAHHDYDSERGDLFPANTPYLVISRGSSGSDRPFLEALAMTLAAFRPDTKQRLIEERMIVPTLQMVFRRSLQNVLSREAYFSGAAHPAVFERQYINAARMVSLANSIAPDEIPAQVRLRVEEEDFGVQGVDFFGLGLSEQLFDTPGAIARIWRSKQGRRSMVVAAADSRDVNDRPLTFHWRLLQGDPGKVTIEPLDDGQRARITLDWHEPFAISEENPLVSSRVDIGVFANNGVHDSAPAIISYYFPPQEARTYAEAADGTPRILSIDYADRADVYVDPLLIARADWRDDYAYADDGTLRGWTRSRAERAPEEFTAEGARILTRGSDGTPERVEAVGYALRLNPEGGLVVEEVSAGAIGQTNP